jgi:hypothetical protein
MIIKKISVSKTTGEETVHFTTDKKGFKVVIKDGSPTEVKMDHDEVSNRDHGANTEGIGKIGSSNKQSGIGRINKEFETKYKEKKQDDNIEYKMSKIDETSNSFQSQMKKVDELTSKLKKAKLDLNSAILNKKMKDFDKKETSYKKAVEYVNKDKSKLKANNMFFLKTEETSSSPIPANTDILDKLKKVESTDSKLKKVEESITFESKMKKIIELDKMVYGDKKRAYVKGDVLERINKKLKEADVKPPEEDKKPSPDDEPAPTDEPTPDAPTDEPTPDSNVDEPTPDAPSDEPTDELAPEDGDAAEEDSADDVPAEPNEVERIVTVNQYNIDSNNVYDFYDFIIDKLVDKTSIEALNAEYSSISKEKRKITSASQLYNRVSKRVAKMNKTENNRLNDELGGASGEDGGDLGGDLNI